MLNLNLKLLASGRLVELEFFASIQSIASIQDGAERHPVLPAPLGAVLVGAARALPLPVPAPAPLLARLGVLACEAVFSRPVLLRRFAAPCDSFPCF